MGFWSDSQVLASLVDSRNNISVPGFYDNVRGGMLDAALARLEASSEFNLNAYQTALGIPSFIKDSSERCAVFLLLCTCINYMSSPLEYSRVYMARSKEEIAVFSNL